MPYSFDPQNTFGLLVLLAVFAMLCVVPVGALMQWRREARQKHQQPKDRLRAQLAQARDQQERLDIVLQTPQGEKVLGEATYVNATNEGIEAEILLPPGAPLCSFPQVHVFFRIKRHGPYSYFHFMTSVEETHKEGNRAKVCLTWPEDVGHGQRQRFPRVADRDLFMPTVRLWRAATDEHGCTHWDPVPEKYVVLTDLNAASLRCQISLSEAQTWKFADPIMCRMALPREYSPKELTLAGAVATLEPTAEHCMIEVRWLRWIEPAQKSMQWHNITEDEEGVAPLAAWLLGRS